MISLSTLCRTGSQLTWSLWHPFLINMQIQYRHLEYFKSKREFRQRLAEDPFFNLKSSLLNTSCGAHVFFSPEIVKFLGSHSNMFCQNTACLLVTVNLIIQNGSTLCCTHHCHFFWVLLFPLWLELKQIEGEAQQRPKTIPAILMKTIS